ncbi:MAG: hypothetical protein JSR46_03960 [Verrucomicrobia bacterium]|nr:hypothetical protein [Verrucomicrobiota bacterium]
MFIHKVCNAFEQAKILYAVVGGYAVALHGAPRGTLDIDFVLRWSLENLEKAEAALKALGLVSVIPVDAQAIFTFRDEYIKNKNLIAWHFYNPVNPSEQVDIIINYDLAKATTKTVQTQSGKIKIMSKNDLIAMKRISGRLQDLEDIKSLEQV